MVAGALEGAATDVLWQTGVNAVRGDPLYANWNSAAFNGAIGGAFGGAVWRAGSGAVGGVGMQLYNHRAHGWGAWQRVNWGRAGMVAAASGAGARPCAARSPNTDGTASRRAVPAGAELGAAAIGAWTHLAATVAASQCPARALSGCHNHDPLLPAFGYPIGMIHTLVRELPPPVLPSFLCASAPSEKSHALCTSHAPSPTK